MNYKVIPIPKFEKDLKRLVKKYPSLKTEFVQWVAKLPTDPHQGVSLGNDCYKIRLAIASKGKGKSGGARIITYVKVVVSQIYLLTIYDKADKGSIDEKELMKLLSLIPE